MKTEAELAEALKVMRWAQRVHEIEGANDLAMMCMSFTGGLEFCLNDPADHLTKPSLKMVEHYQKKMRAYKQANKNGRLRN